MSHPLWKKVLIKAKPSFQTRVDDNNKPYKTVANLGLSANDQCFRSSGGEYKGLTVQVLEDVKPLLTSTRMSRAIKQLDEEAIPTAGEILNILDQMQKHGINIVYNIVNTWLKKNDIDIPSSYKEAELDIELDKDLVTWITTVRNEPINAKLKVIAIGKSKKGNSVVPESWIDREFKNGYELHTEMDKLDWRKGKPPVYYCCIYSMSCIDNNTWIPLNDLSKKQKFNHVFLITNITGLTVKLIDDVNKVQNKEQLSCLSYNMNNATILFIIHSSVIMTPTYLNNEETVGYLVSTLQKCVRRGRHCSKTLYDIVYKLHKATPYNLPDQQYLKVSGCRQLFWRAFISIIEDAKPYEDSDEYLSLFEIFVIALLCQADPNIQIDISIIDVLCYTLLLVQYNDANGTNWSWRKGSNKISTSNHSFNLALKYMPMMKNDRTMLIKGYNYLKNIDLKKLKILTLDQLLKESTKKCELDTALAGYDMHCIPNIIIELQASFPESLVNKYSTKEISSMIWNYSSKFNVRNKELIKQDDQYIDFCNSLKNIQRYKHDSEFKTFNIDDVKDNTEKTINKFPGVTNIKRTSFLLIFGQQVHLVSNGKNNPTLDVCVCGTPESICKIKSKNVYLEGKQRIEGERRYYAYMNKKNKHIITLPKPPVGYTWNTKSNKVHIYVVEQANNIWFYCNDVKMSPFDGTPMLIAHKPIISYKLPKQFDDIISQSMYIDKEYDYNEYELNLALIALHKQRRAKKHNTVYDWAHYIKKSPLPKELWMLITVRLYNGFDNEVFVGPVDRLGCKVNRSINYYYEGYIWRMLNMLAMLYPDTLVITGNFKYQLNMDSLEYQHLIQSLKVVEVIKTVTMSADKPVINTKLWDHQAKTSNMMTDGYLNHNIKGFGDASHVGAGKSLTALSVMCNLCAKDNSSYSFIVLLPTINLYQTWTDEITKHTKNFKIIRQTQTGSLINSKDQTIEDIHLERYIIVVTTLARIREHPIRKRWTLVVIDECLSVQNKDALQTEEAWRQTMCSTYGVLMLSATFFRSRFDKMFYMISMLKSTLPIKKEYLDTILSEHIISNIPANARKWVTTTTKIELEDDIRKEYDKLKKTNVNSEKKYILLNKYIYDNIDYVACFEDKLSRLSKHKVLIYAKTAKEADEIAKIKNVSRFPDVKKQHVVASINEATYGVNTLIAFDTILTRVPEPDKLPQMKGRLDRPGQKNKILYLEYILLKDTIEEAGIFRMDMCNTFHKTHIMPLAKFYDMAIKY